MTLSPIHARIHAEYRHASCVMQITHTRLNQQNKVDIKLFSIKPSRKA